MIQPRLAVAPLNCLTVVLDPQTLEDEFEEAKRSEASAALSSRSEGSGGSPRRDRETASERKEKRRGEQLMYVYTVNEKMGKGTPEIRMSPAVLRSASKKPKRS